MQLLKNTHYFMVAHPDDVELFMFKGLLDALRNGEKVVLMVLTAGDDGQGYQPDEGEKAYWFLRNLGHQRAIEFLAHRINGEINFKSRSKSPNYHHINNIYLYNFLIPDQYVNQKNQLTFLSELFAGGRKNITTIDEKITYTKRNLFEAILELCKKHKSYFENFLHITDETADLSVDHIDHRVVSLLGIDVFKQMNIPEENFIRYQTYQNYKKPINLSEQETHLHAAVWGIYNSFLLERYQNLSGPLQINYLGKQYRYAFK